MLLKIIPALLILSPLAVAHEAPTHGTYAITSLTALRQVGVNSLEADPENDIAIAYLTAEDQDNLLRWNHSRGKCAGFEALPEVSNFLQANFKEELGNLTALVEKEKSAQNFISSAAVEKNHFIDVALDDIKESNLLDTVTWLQSFPDRNNKSTSKNVHVNEFEAKLKTLMQGYSGPYTVEQIKHKSTGQNSIRVHLEGAKSPDEIIVLGAHLDSINMSWGGSKIAPGADDNASGSAAILEALRVLIQKGAPERTVEFFWYAGEESGLLGSSEIAADYKSKNKNVIAVLQLDMVLFPGSGELVIGNMTDFTSAWLHRYLYDVARTYLGAKVEDSKCGYGCSDHASWFRKGYSTLMPFESTMDDMNHKIHTENDKINASYNFKHAAAFSKLALVFAMDLGNSNRKGDGETTLQ